MTKPFMKTTRCTISTLSPVHIGCGDDYYPTNYVIDDGLLHHFSEEGLLAALSSSEKNALAKIAEEKNDKSDSGIKKLQEFIHSKKDKLQLYATHSVPLSKELENFYLSRIGKITQREGNGRNVNNQLAIARHAFNPYSQTPYFPGSSIKGAIRTALLNAENDGQALPFRTDENRDIPKGENDKLQKRLFDYQAIGDKPEKGIKGDPLRLLKVSDANYQDLDALHGLEVSFAVNRKNKPSKEKSQAEQKGLYQLLECLPANRHQSLDFSVTFLAGEKSACFADMQAVAKSCNDFFLPQLKQELALMQQLNYAGSAWLNGLEKLLAGELGQALQQNKAFLLRIGQHGGAESNTLEGVRHIKIMQGKEKDGTKRPDKYLSKPSTIWLAGDNKDQQRDLLPFGWVLVEVGNADLKQTAQFLREQAAEDYQKQQQLQALAEQRIKFLAEDKQRRALKAAQEQQAEEEKRLQAKAEVEKAAQMATMSEAEKLIFALQEEFDKSTPQNQPISGTLNPKLTALISQAADWQAQDKQALFDLGARINKKLWNDNKKVKERLKILQS